MMTNFYNRCVAPQKFKTLSFGPIPLAALFFLSAGMIAHGTAATPAEGDTKLHSKHAPQKTFEPETTARFDSLKAAIDDPKFDRLDGHGRSGKRVDLIEWEGNLEIHVYPGGSLAGLAVKIDDREPKKPVLVIGYRFDKEPKRQLIRRAASALQFKKGFNVYKDPSSGTEYDKVILSQNKLAAPMTLLSLDPEPTQLYPAGHPGNEAPPERKIEGKPLSETRSEKESREPAAAEGFDEETGTLRPFRW